MASHAALKATTEGMEREFKRCRDELEEAQREITRLRDSQAMAANQQAETLGNGTREADSLKAAISHLESEIASLRGKLEEAVRDKDCLIQQSESALTASHGELKMQHEAAVAALVCSHQAEKQTALAALEERLMSDVASRERSLREELVSAHDTEVKTLAVSHANQLETAIQSLRLELESSYRVREHELREEFVQTHSKEIAELNDNAAQGLQAALEAARADLKSSVDSRESEVRKELQTAHDSEMESMKMEFESQLAEAVAKVWQDAEDQRKAELDALARQKDIDLESALAAAELKFRHEVEAVSKERDAALLRATEAINELEARVRQAVSTAESRKDEERVAALFSLREELQILVDAANAERDEFFKLYSKVNLKRLFRSIYIGVRRESSERRFTTS